MNKLWIAAALAACLWPSSVRAQANCVEGGTYTDAQGGIMYCTGVGTAIKMAKYADAGGVPAGLITLSLTSCPTGWAEASALNGVMLRGTVAANGNVGTTGGSDSRTPAGTLTWPASVPTFAGSSGTTSAVSAGTPAGTIANHTIVSTKQGASAGNVVTTATHVFTGSALATHTHTLTPSGTIAWPASVPTFAGSALDVRPAYLNVIFCVKQ